MACNIIVFLKIRRRLKIVVNECKVLYCYYRPRRSCEGYVFTRVCLSTGGDVPGPGKVCSGGGVPGAGGLLLGRCLVPGGGLVSQHALRQAPLPQERRLLLPTVHILLDCILVTKSVPSVAELQENVPFTHIALLPTGH